MERTLELEDALATAERANASKSRFVAAACHDLLQPISAAKLFMSSLARPPRQPRRPRRAGEGRKRALLRGEPDRSPSRHLETGIRTAEFRHPPGRASRDPRSAARRDGGARRTQGARLAHRRLGTDRRDRPRLSAAGGAEPARQRRALYRTKAACCWASGAKRQRAGSRCTIPAPESPKRTRAPFSRSFERLDASASRNDGLGLGLAIVERACARLGHPLGSVLRAGARHLLHGQRAGRRAGRPRRPSGDRRPRRSGAARAVGAHGAAGRERSLAPPRDYHADGKLGRERDRGRGRRRGACPSRRSGARPGRAPARPADRHRLDGNRASTRPCGNAGHPCRSRSSRPTARRPCASNARGSACPRPAQAGHCASRRGADGAFLRDLPKAD